MPNWLIAAGVWILWAVILAWGYWMFRHKARDREDLLHGGEGWDER